MPNPPLSRPYSRGIPVGLAQTSLEQDLQSRATATTASTTIGPSGLGLLSVINGANTFPRVNTLTVTGDAVVTDLGGGDIQLQVNGSPTSPTSFEPTEIIVFQAQQAGADDNTGRNKTFRNMTQFTDARYIIVQTNTGGDTYSAEFFDPSSGLWWPFLPQFVTGGNGTYLSTDLSIDSVTLGGPDIFTIGLPEIRVRNSFGGGSTDVSYCALLLHGPAISGLNGTNGSDGSVIYDGSGVPSSGLGQSGDYYIDVSSGNMYRKTGSTWAIDLNITGPAGPSGSFIAIDVAGNYVIPAGYYEVGIDASGGAATYKLPAASLNIAKPIYISKIDSSANALTPLFTGSDMLEAPIGVGTISLQWDCLRFYANPSGTGWRIS